MQETVTLVAARRVSLPRGADHLIDPPGFSGFSPARGLVCPSTKPAIAQTHLPATTFVSKDSDLIEYIFSLFKALEITCCHGRQALVLCGLHAQSNGGIYRLSSW